MAILFIVLGLLCVGARFIFVPMVETEIKNANELMTLDNKVYQTMKELDNLQYSIGTSGKTVASLEENKDTYVKNLGLLCTANSLNIHKMTVDDIITDSSGMSSMTVELQLQGSLKEVMNFVNDIYDSKMMCRINSISYRLEGESFSWMWRAIDDNDMVEWWDISDINDYLLEDPDAETSDEDMDILGASAFMQHGTALCYLNVQFIGTEG